MDSDGPTCTRRRVLAVSATTVLASTAGCTAIPDFLASQFFDLDEVNVFNSTDGQIDGRVTVRTPAGRTALDEAFELRSSDNSSIATFADVWGDPGAYEVAVELAGTEIDGVSRATETAAVEDPEEEMLGVLLGSESMDAAIGFRVGKSFSELAGE